MKRLVFVIFLGSLCLTSLLSQKWELELGGQFNRIWDKDSEIGFDANGRIGLFYVEGHNDNWIHKAGITLDRRSSTENTEFADWKAEGYFLQANSKWVWMPKNIGILIGGAMGPAINTSEGYSSDDAAVAATLNHSSKLMEVWFDFSAMAGLAIRLSPRIDFELRLQHGLLPVRFEEPKLYQQIIGASFGVRL